jgi:hypothetical protein
MSLPTSTPKPRKAPRNAVTMPARCRTMSGMRDDGELSDISTRGCCVTTRGLFLHIGHRVIIKPEGMEGITGVVRWLSGNRAGIEFDMPLYGPIVEHMSARHAISRRVGIEYGRR